MLRLACSLSLYLLLIIGAVCFLPAHPFPPGQTSGRRVATSPPPPGPTGACNASQAAYCSLFCAAGAFCCRHADDSTPNCAPVGAPPLDMKAYRCSSQCLMPANKSPQPSPAPPKSPPPRPFSPPLAPPPPSTVSLRFSDEFNAGTLINKVCRKGRAVFDILIVLLPSQTNWKFQIGDGSAYGIPGEDEARLSFESLSLRCHNNVPCFRFWQ